MPYFTFSISLRHWRLPEITDSPSFQKIDFCCVHKQLTVRKLNGWWGENRINHSSFRLFVFEYSVSGKDRGYVLSKVPSNAFFQQKLLRMSSVTKPLKMDMQWVAVRVLETHVRNNVVWFPISPEVLSKGRSNFLKERDPRNSELHYNCKFFLSNNFNYLTSVTFLFFPTFFHMGLCYKVQGVMWVVDFSYESWVIPMVILLAGLWPERLNLLEFSPLLIILKWAFDTHRYYSVLF